MPDPFLAAQGTRWELTLNRTPFHRRATHTHTHSGWDKWDAPVYFMCMPLGCGKKLRSPEKTHSPGENVQTLHRQGPWPGIDFFLVNVITKQQLKERTCDTSCVTLGKFLEHSVSVSSSLKWRLNDSTHSHRTVERLKAIMCVLILEPGT